MKSQGNGFGTHFNYGVLVELLDPEQNHAYVDHYIDYPVDLRRYYLWQRPIILPVATAVLDRLEPISMPSYSDEKITIGRDYMFLEFWKNQEFPKGDLAIRGCLATNCQTAGV
jgi:ATP-dependent Lon protease